MRILFTGASSFTGYWFVRELVAAGHEVVAACRGDGRYEGLRAERMRMVRELCETRYSCALGSDDFLALTRTSDFDVLCHHGAQVGDYRSPDFDPYRAAAANLHSLPEVLRALKDRGCGRLVLTGTFFEANEGAGSKPLRAFNAYGLSKGLTATAAAFYAGHEGFTFEKFVIPHPFGPYEEPRFTAYLMKTWQAGETARVQTPRYVRDNIHVSLLAKAYAGFVGASPPPGMVRRLNPIGAMRRPREPLPGACVMRLPPASASLAASSSAHRPIFQSHRCASTPISSIRRHWDGARRRHGTISCGFTRRQGETTLPPRFYL